MSNKATRGSPTVKSNRYWTLLVILLIVIIAISSLVIWSRYQLSQPIEISLSPSQELLGEIYIGGAVSNPGFYSFKSGDALGNIIQAAGGPTTEADLNHLKLYISKIDETGSTQQVNLNQAEAWLLQALPGIGEVRAQAIIDYRQRNGHFRNIGELIKVEGIGTVTYERIKHLITVDD